MTEEEMAEEYEENAECVEVNDYGWKVYGSIEIEEAFLAGLKAGKTKWHKVADEGLPINKNDGATYLLYTIYGECGSPVVAHFADRDKQELMNVWTGEILTEDKIVAWKEIVLPEGE